jgi:hypothetical protein
LFSHNLKKYGPLRILHVLQATRRSEFEDGLGIGIG